jgi:putative transposase
MAFHAEVIDGPPVTIATRRVSRARGERGINHAACFQRDNDYLCYLQLVTEHAQQFCCAVHAYVLMTNHVHLLVTPQHADGLSLLMKNVGRRYVQYVSGRG